MRTHLLAIAAACAVGACASAGDDAGGPTDGSLASQDGPPADGCLDTDQDGVCNHLDVCPGADDAADTDSDTVPDGCDDCPGQDDRIDTNGNSIPDCSELQTRTVDVKVVGSNIWRGWHSTANDHMATNDNTLTGTFVATTYNSYYVFSLAGFTASRIASVTLEAQLEAYDSPDATETFSLWDVSTDPSTLENSSGTAATFDDLQSGTQYATAMAPKTGIGQTIAIPLNAAAATNLQARLGQDFAIGMHLDTAPTWIRFGHTATNGNPPPPVTFRLQITYTP